MPLKENRFKGQETRVFTTSEIASLGIGIKREAYTGKPSLEEKANIQTEKL